MILASLSEERALRDCFTMTRLVPLTLIVILMLISLALPTLPVQAQDDSGEYEPAILVCGDDGCQHTRMSGEFAETDMEILIGEENPYGEDGYVVCSAGPCTWTQLDPADLDLVHGGDGEVDMIFEEEDVEAIDDDTPIDPDVEFDFSDIDARDITPSAGTWTAYHQAGQMNCTSGLTIDIPAGDIQSGELVVSEDGNTLTLNDLDPEAASVPMERIAPGTYHGELEVTADGQTMIVNFDEKFVDTFLGLGLIWSEVAVQGYECRIERRFYTIYGGEDGFMFAEEQPEAIG